jgi:hypothetical protein
MAASAKSLEEVLREVTEELGRLNNDKSAVSLPRYTQYDGLRVIERDGATDEGTDEARSA